MFLKNNSPRLISINIPGKGDQKAEAIDLMPAGKAEQVPDAVCKTRYVRALIQSESVKEVDAPGGSDSKSDDPLDDMTVADLKAYADGLELEYESNIKKADLKTLIKDSESE